MPKILILLMGQPTEIANAVADGARSVRFSEVELRRVDRPGHAEPTDKGTIVQTLAGVEEIVPYDAIVVTTLSEGALHPGLEELLVRAAASAPRSAWQNKVGAAFAAESGETAGDVWPTLKTLGELGMLVVSPSGKGVDAARALGARVAQVVGWVTHARSHHHH